MNDKGFTLIELVIILVLIGILAAFVAPRLPDVGGTKAAAFLDKLRADIRFTQSLAMTKNLRYRIYFNGSGGGAPVNGYSAVNDTNGNNTWGEAGEIAVDPAGNGNLIVALGAGDYGGITVSTPAGGFIEFNSLGAPTVGGGVAIVVSGNAVPVGTVAITAQTGAVN